MPFVHILGGNVFNTNKFYLTWQIFFFFFLKAQKNIWGYVLACAYLRKPILLI